MTYLSFLGSDTVVIAPPPELAPDEPELGISDPLESMVDELPESMLEVAAELSVLDPTLGGALVASLLDMVLVSLLVDVLLGLLVVELSELELVPHEDNATSAAAPIAPSTAVRL